jgi:hypothetical protein
MQLSARAIGYDRRTDDRTRIERPAVLRIADIALDIRVEDLTRDGCKISTDMDLEIGSTVTLGFAGIGRATAQVVRRDAAGYGCIFDETLPSGAVTAATRNNVDHFSGSRAIVQPVDVADVKWSPRQQALLVIGATSALWGLVILGAAQFI